MTISSETGKTSLIAGDGTTTSFSFSPIVVQEPATGEDHELAVYSVVNATGVATLLSEGTTSSTYSVTVADYPGTGTITYPASGGTPLASTSSILIVRKLPLTQATDLENRGGYLPEVQEGQYDRFTMTDIQQQEQLDRSLKLPVSSTIDSEVPFPVADRFIKFNSTATGLELASELSLAAAASAVPQDVALAGAVGTSEDYARADHVHDIGTSGEVVNDTAPQLGGDLDVNGNSLVSIASGNISITPNGGGRVILDGISYPDTDGSSEFILKTDGAGVLSFTEQVYDFGAVFEAEPTTSTVFTRVQVARPLFLSADMAGSFGAVDTNPTATYNVDVQDDGVSIGTISVSTGGVVTFTTTGGLGKSIAAGSVIKFISPASADGTVAGFSAILKVRLN